MANYMNSQKKRGPKQRDLSLDGLNYVDLGSSKVCVSLPLKLMIGWTDGTSLEAPRLELGRAFVGRMMVTLYQVRSFIVSLKKRGGLRQWTIVCSVTGTVVQSRFK